MTRSLKYPSSSYHRTIADGSNASGNRLPRRADALAQHDASRTHELQGFGGIGEGMAMQLTRDGRRILWLAHESAPKNFTGVDVTDPRAPRVVVQTELPHAKVRSNSLDVVGDIMAVAYQTSNVGLKPAGFDLFDISTPEQPKLISHFDASGPHSRGVHAVWFVDGEYVHMASGARGLPAAPSERRPVLPHRRRAQSLASRSRPAAGGCPARATATARRRRSALDPKFDAGFRAHNTNVFPQRPDRAYVGYIDGGAVILDIADKAHPEARRPLALFAAVQRLHATRCCRCSSATC